MKLECSVEELKQLSKNFEIKKETPVGATTDASNKLTYPNLNITGHLKA